MRLEIKNKTYFRGTKLKWVVRGGGDFLGFVSDTTLKIFETITYYNINNLLQDKFHNFLNANKSILLEVRYAII